MQVFGNVASQPEVKQSKTSQRNFVEFRLAESQRGVDSEPTWYSVRVMGKDKPSFGKGDFVKVTGKLKTDFYLSREGKPTGTLLADDEGNSYPEMAPLDGFHVNLAIGRLPENLEPFVMVPKTPARVFA